MRYTKRDLLNDQRFKDMADDEEIFPLYGRDDQAPARVRDWATQRRADISLGKRPESDSVHVTNAFLLAERMDEWRLENDGKWRTGLFGDQRGDWADRVG